MNKNCLNCFYNFEGFCANHIKEKSDTYGKSIDELIKKYPFSCSGYRKIPIFLNEQKSGKIKKT